MKCPYCQTGHFNPEPSYTEEGYKIWRCSNSKHYQCLAVIYHTDEFPGYYQFLLEGLEGDPSEILLETDAKDFLSALNYFQRVWKLKAFL